MSSRKTKSKTTKKRAQRATSNVFAMFDQAQIQEFKEAFNMIDQNRDGFIDKEDLADMLASLGRILLWTLEDHIFHFLMFFFVFSTSFLILSLIYLKFSWFMDHCLCILVVTVIVTSVLFKVVFYGKIHILNDTYRIYM